MNECDEKQKKLASFIRLSVCLSVSSDHSSKVPHSLTIESAACVHIVLKNDRRGLNFQDKTNRNLFDD